MFKNLEYKKIENFDRTILEIAIKQICAYKNMTVQVFAELIEEETNEKTESWTLNKLNKILDGDMHLTARRRKLILEKIRELNPEGHIYKQTILDLLGLKTQKVFEQLKLFITLFV